jgi:hypothetical protein
MKFESEIPHAGNPDSGKKQHALMRAGAALMGSSSSVPNPKFAARCRTFFGELRIQRGHQDTEVAVQKFS